MGVFESFPRYLAANEFMKGGTQAQLWFQNSCRFSLEFLCFDWHDTGLARRRSSLILRPPDRGSQVFWGIVLGGVYAVMADGLLFQPYFITVGCAKTQYAGLNIFSLLIVALIASVFFTRCRGARGQEGWLSTIERALGLPSAA